VTVVKRGFQSLLKFFTCGIKGTAKNYRGPFNYGPFVIKVIADFVPPQKNRPQSNQQKRTSVPI